MSVPNTGILGSIRNYLLDQAEVVQAVGQKIYPGRIASGFTSQSNTSVVSSSMPYILTNHVANHYQTGIVGLLGQRVKQFQAIVQVSIFASGYDAARNLGDLVDSKITEEGVTFSENGILCYLTPQTWILTPDTHRNEQGQDVWMSVFRYWVVLPKQQSNVALLNVLNGFGAINFPAFVSAGGN